MIYSIVWGIGMIVVIYCSVCILGISSLLFFVEYIESIYDKPAICKVTKQKLIKICVVLILLIIILGVPLYWYSYVAVPIF